MLQHAPGSRTKTYILLAGILLLNSLALADTESVNIGNTKSAKNSDIVPGNKPLNISPNEFIDFDDDSTLAAEEPEPRNNELQNLLNHQQESHFHLHGGIMLNDDATMVHPSLDDIDGVEVDITIDFE